MSKKKELAEEIFMNLLMGILGDLPTDEIKGVAEHKTKEVKINSEKKTNEQLETCPDCDGAGYISCTECDGDGYILKRKNVGVKNGIEECGVCNGIGEITCKTCYGSGKVPTKTPITEEDPEVYNTIQTELEKSYHSSVVGPIRFKVKKIVYVDGCIIVHPYITFQTLLYDAEVKQLFDQMAEELNIKAVKIPEEYFAPEA